MADYKNIVGTPFPDFVQTQINKREELENSSSRSSSTLQWLTNRNSFFRLSSGANIFNQGIGFTPDLAKANVLQGGIVSVNEENQSTTFRKGFNETYKQGATDQLGFKPMPGITNVTVDTGGKWQTSLEASVSFICYDLDQLNLMQRLYMSLGVTVFLEWGHYPYIDNNGNLENNVQPINFFNYVKKRELLKKVTKKREETNGNYDALVGTVYNFDWSSNKDGSYNCTVKILGPGGMVESLRINNPVQRDYDQSNDNESKKYTSQIENALIAIKKFLSRTGLSHSIKKQGGEYGLNSEVKTSFGAIGRDNFFQTFRVNDPNTGELIDKSYGDLLNQIYADAPYKGPRFTSSGGDVQINGNSSLKYGNAWQLEAGLTDKNVSELDASVYYAYTSLFSPSSTLSGASVEQTAEYITLAHLLTIVQHLGVFGERCKGDSQVESPILIDYNPDNTIVKTGVVQASVNPKVCLIPFKVKDSETYSRFFSPLNIFSKEKLPFQGDNEFPPAEFNLSNSEILQISPINTTFKNLGAKVDALKSSGIGYDGKLQNVLVNIDFALETFSSISNNNQQSVDLMAYINAILDGINLSLGKVNNFRVVPDDTSHCLRIVDNHYNEKLKEENILVIPNFGTKSLTYDYKFSSKITPKLSSQIIISTQATDGGGLDQFPEDVLSYKKLNYDVLDRFSEVKLIDNFIQSKENTNKPPDLRKPLLKLLTHLWSTYNLKASLRPEEFKDFTKIYSDIQNKITKITEGKSGTLLIPIEYDITLDGISGILPYNVFKVPDNRLPEKYRGRVAFVVFSINHGFSANKWTTNLRGITILLDRGAIEDYIDLPTVDNSYTPISLSSGNPFGFDETVGFGSQIPLATNDIKATVDFLKKEEGFRENAYWDVNAYRIGYGSDTITKPNGSTLKVTATSKVNEEDATRDLERRVLFEFKPKAESALQSQGMLWEQLSRAAQVVFIDLAYNYGSVFDDLSGAYAEGYRNGGLQNGGKAKLIAALNARIARGSSQTPSRRLAEINYLQKYE